MCLAEYSRMWKASLNSSIRYVAYSNPISFASSLNWDLCHKGVSIYTCSMASASQTMESEASFMVEWRMVWYDHNILGSSSAHKPCHC